MSLSFQLVCSLVLQKGDNGGLHDSVYTYGVRMAFLAFNGQSGIAIDEEELMQTRGSRGDGTSTGSTVY